MYSKKIDYLEPLPSGAVPLFPNCFFPWGALPYPQQHAELGMRFLEKSEKESTLHEIAIKMADFQEATFNHYHQPIFSFLQQEGCGSQKDLISINRSFFEMLKRKPVENFRFFENTLAFFSQRSLDTTLLLAGSGCKSGMGYFMFKEAGLINFGPQLLPFGDCSAFSLAGRANHIYFKETADAFHFSYQNRLAAPHSRKTGVDFLKDSGYSGLWMEAMLKGNLNGFSLEASFQGRDSVQRLVFSFFIKADACVVAGSHRLKPRSSDRYLGPPQAISFLSKEEGIELNACEGLAQMEVCPLMGDSKCWGADFLVGFTLKATTVRFSLKRHLLVF